MDTAPESEPNTEPVLDEEMSSDDDLGNVGGSAPRPSPQIVPSELGGRG